jgi:hypothetical protein
MKFTKLFFLTINTRTQTHKVGADVSSARGVWGCQLPFSLESLAKCISIPWWIVV